MSHRNPPYLIPLHQISLQSTNTASVLFTCFYVLTGVAFLAFTLDVLGNRIIQKHDVLRNQAEANNQKEVMALFGTMPDVYHHLTFSSRNLWFEESIRATLLTTYRSYFVWRWDMEWVAFSLVMSSDFGFDVIHCPSVGLGCPFHHLLDDCDILYHRLR